MAAFTEIKMPGRGAGLKEWGENQESFDIFSLKCLLLIPSSDVNSREIRTENLNLGIIHRERGNESMIGML